MVNNAAYSDVATSNLRLFEYTLPEAGVPPVLIRTVELAGFDDIEGLSLVEDGPDSVKLVVSEEGKMNLVMFALDKVGALLRSTAY